MVATILLNVTSIRIVETQHAIKIASDLTVTELFDTILKAHMHQTGSFFL